MEARPENFITCANCKGTGKLNFVKMQEKIMKGKRKIKCYPLKALRGDSDNGNSQF